MANDSNLIKGNLEDTYTLNPDGTYSDLPRSNMPIAKDNINEMQDLTLDLLPVKNQFYQYMEAGDLTNASEVISNNPKLLSSLFNADKYNSLRDSIMALQRLYLDDIENYIITLSEPKGEYQENKEYKKYQVVSYNYEDATQFYCARQMVVPSNNSVSYNANPTNTYYWTPVTLRGMQGYSGTGLTPMGEWTSNKNYYNYINNETNMPIVSMVYWKNIWWQAKSNNINSEPSYSNVNGISISNNSNWEIIMALNQSANTILMPYNQPISEVIDRADQRSGLDLQVFIKDGYNYYANKVNANTYIETLKDRTTNEIAATKTSTKLSNGSWNINYNFVNSGMNYTTRFTPNGSNWTGVLIES